MNRSLWLRGVLAVLVLLALVDYRRGLSLLAAPLSLGGAVVLVYLGLSVVCLAGLVLRRDWGFYALYALVPFGTVMLAVEFAPIPLGSLPVSRRWIGLTLVNAAVLTFAGVAHYWLRHDAGGPRGLAA